MDSPRRQCHKDKRLHRLPHLLGRCRNIASFTATPASSHGYGMAATKDDSSALTDTVSNFGAVYAATRESQRTNNKAINAMQVQIQMLCQALGSHLPPNMMPYQQQQGARHPRGG